LKAKEDASRVALLASLMKENRFYMDIKKIRKDMNDLGKIEGINLPSDYNILNKLKNVSAESFYLWAVALKAL